MRQNYLSDVVPVYLDGEAKRLLAEGRAAFKRFGLDQAAIQTAPEGGWIVATWAGTAQNAALALALKARGFDVEQRDGLLEVASAEESLPAALAAIAAASPPDVRDLLNSPLKKAPLTGFHPTVKHNPAKAVSHPPRR